MIVDANVLVYAGDESSTHHAVAERWLTDALNSDRRVGLPWQSLGAFLRIATHPRIFSRPLSQHEAQTRVDTWLASGSVWVPPATERTVATYAALARRHHATGNLVPDAQLAALALEHGVEVVSTDTDFARFTEVRWVNPLQA